MVTSSIRLQVPTLRVDLSIGKVGDGVTTWSREIVGGTANNIKYYWTEIDSLSSVRTDYHYKELIIIVIYF